MKNAVEPEDAATISWARKLYHREGELEIDDGAVVSRADGNPSGGAYVQAWVWVPDEDVDQCGCEVPGECAVCAPPVAGPLNCECEDGKLGPYVGFLHMDNSLDGPELGRNGQHIECCDSCDTLPDDETAIALHAAVCGCGWGDVIRASEVQT